MVAGLIIGAALVLIAIAIAVVPEIRYRRQVRRVMRVVDQIVQGNLWK